MGETAGNGLRKEDLVEVQEWIGQRQSADDGPGLEVDRPGFLGWNIGRQQSCVGLELLELAETQPDVNPGLGQVVGEPPAALQDSRERVLARIRGRGCPRLLCRAGELAEPIGLDLLKAILRGCPFRRLRRASGNGTDRSAENAPANQGNRQARR